MLLRAVYIGVFTLLLFLFIPLSFSKSFIIANSSQPSQSFFVVNGTTGTTNIAGNLFHDSAVASDWIIKNMEESKSIIFSINYGGTFRDLLVLNGSDSTTYIGYGDISMVIDALGNVGIGTTSPSHTLDVAGDIKASGLLYPGKGSSLPTCDANSEGGIYYNTNDHKFYGCEYDTSTSTDNWASLG